MSHQHSAQAAGKWFTLSLCNQMGNIGSKIGRATLEKQKSQIV